MPCPAESKGLNNVAFAALLQLQDTAACVDLLLATDRVPEAALFARTYAPSQASRVVKAWKADLAEKKRHKIAAGIADPEDADEGGEELFENWQEALQAEREGKKADHPAREEKDLLGDEDPAELVEKLRIGENLVLLSCSRHCTTLTDRLHPASLPLYRRRRQWGRQG